MEVYVLARWALDATTTYERLAAKVGDTRPAVSAEQRALTERGAATPPPGYIEDPYDRPDVRGELTIGAPEPGATPFYLQDYPDDRWTPPDLTRPATAFETVPQRPTASYQARAPAASRALALTRRSAAPTRWRRNGRARTLNQTLALSDDAGRAVLPFGPYDRPGALEVLRGVRSRRIDPRPRRFAPPSNRTC